MGFDGLAYYRDHFSLERSVDRFEEALARAAPAKPKLDAVQRLADWGWAVSRRGGNEESFEGFSGGEES